MAIGMEGATELMVKGNGLGTGWKGHYPTGLGEAFGRGLRERVNDVADTVKLVMLLGEHLRRTSGGRYYARGQNLGRSLRAAYDAALDEADVLVMPMLPTPLPAPDASREEYIGRAFEMVLNTAPLDVTGHPAITVPCQPAGSPPIGMMIVGRHFADASVLRVAAAAEVSVTGGGGHRR